MDEARAAIDGLAPIIVDHQLAAGGAANAKRAGDCIGDCGGGSVFHAQLDELDAEAGETSGPFRIRHDGIEFGEHGANPGRLGQRPGSTGLPCRAAA